MKLVSFSVENYRSIIKAHKIKLGQSTVLVGPNNEGKSNVIKGLVTAMAVLKENTRGLAFRHPVGISRLGNVVRIVGAASVRPKGVVPQVRVPNHVYNWENDFPISLQTMEPDGESVFNLEFALDASEIAEFRTAVHSSLNGTLPLEIAIDHSGRATVRVAKRGRGRPALSAKSNIIARFVSERLEFEYIPAIRTAQSAERVVNSMIERELALVEDSAEYSQAVAKIRELQKPILDKLSQSIKPTMQKFLPAIKNIEFEIADEDRVRALRRSAKMIVDDGSPTYLRYKGDGVQSLAALALMRHASEIGAAQKNFVIAVEEPESHLHPNAIHSLRTVLQELATEHQLVTTTHNPLFVQRSNLSSNIIVNNSKAKPAKSIEEIREILGVRAADNLRNAELVVLVEGEDDKIALTAILQSLSSKVKQALQAGSVALDSLAGGSNLSYKIGLIRDSLCSTHCFVDHDRAGKEGVQKAKLAGLLIDSDVTFASVSGMPESELEDCYDSDFYADAILNRYRVSLQDPKFRTKKKWSERMHQTFIHQGQTWDDQVKAKLKLQIAGLVAANPESALNEHKKGCLLGLAKALEARLNELPLS
jgi:putative ATP-dependent endonuclease of the OLD family